MPIWVAILLGVVEGLTEFLPVSSTGHLILVSRALGYGDNTTKAFEVVIQSGALVAVLIYFRTLIGKHLRGLARRDAASIRLFSAIVAAFFPTAVAGLLLRKVIKKFLFGPLPVAFALFVGGVLMLAMERAIAKRPARIENVDAIDIKTGFMVGLAQCFALWPGASRAMTTIVGARLLGMNAKTAAEFSFLLALPTLGAATVLDWYKDGGELLATADSTRALLVGLLTSAVVAWAVIRLFLQYLEKRGLTVFAYYRMLLGLIVLVVFFSSRG